MSSRKHLSELALFNLDMESRKMKVLKAVLKSVEGESATSDFDTIFEIVNDGRDDNLSKAWIYKCLGELEEDKFVVVDRISTPNKYMATKETIAKALETIKSRRIAKLQKDLDDNRRARRAVLNASSSNLARELAGKSEQPSRQYSQLIQGNENIRNALVRQICNAAGEDSIIRISNSSNSLGGDLDERGPVEVRMLEQAVQGVEFRVLLFREQQETNEPKSISSFMHDALPLLGKAVSSGCLKFRVIEEKSDTYRAVIRDDELMILYFTDTYKANTAFLVTKQDNELLIRDTANTFDQYWEQAADMTAMMKSAISQAK
ncbi:MAG: hypothetical protein R6V83_09755 [Candidatus Thorarchaeota archaeon]